MIVHKNSKIPQHQLLTVPSCLHPTKGCYADPSPARLLKHNVPGCAGPSPGTPNVPRRTGAGAFHLGTAAVGEAGSSMSAF